MKKIDVSTKKHPVLFTMVSDEWFEGMNKHRWYGIKHRNTFYVQRTVRVGGKRITHKMHIDIMQPAKGKQVHHINGNGLDNREENLLIVTPREHSSFSKVTKTSKYPGVHRHPINDSWVARISIRNKTKYLGSFKKEIDAYNCYKKACKAIENGRWLWLKKRKTASKYKGVTYQKSCRKWVARIGVNGAMKYLGSFKTEAEAYQCRNHFEKVFMTDTVIV